MSTLDELANRGGKWLALSAAAAGRRHTAAVVADRFDRITWRDTYEQSAGLREVAEELNERYDHATDLLIDVFLAAYKVRPRLREGAEMDPSRLVNHQVITALVESREFAELRRETAGDPYAAAMAGQSREALSEWVIKEAHNKLARAGKRLEKLRDDAARAGRSTAAIDRVTGRQRAVRARVLTEALGVDASMVQAQP